MSSKIKQKRGNVNGFDGIHGKETNKRIKNWQKNQPAGRWRSVKQIRIKYTYITQSWFNDDKTFSQKFICPLGMVNFIKNLLEEERSSHRFSILPNAVKEAFLLSNSADYDKDNLKIVCTDDGDKGYNDFYILFCTKCMKNNSEFIKKYQEYLPENPKIEDIQENWDKLIAADCKVAHYADYCGCIVPNEPEVIAAPNNRRFILRPTEHSEKYHKMVNTATHTTPSEGGSKRPLENDTTIEISPSKKSCNKNILLNSSGQLRTYENCSVTGTSNNQKVKVTVKGQGLKFTQKTIDSMIDPKISIFSKANNETEEWAQNNALSIILSGTNKNLSQAAIVHLYNTAMNGVQSYHQTVLGNIELNGKKISPPPRVAINEDNILSIQSGLLEAYKKMDCNISPYKALHCSLSKFYSIFNDGIQKFSKELNGVMLRTLDENLIITNIPWALTSIEGGSMNSIKLCSQIMSIISSINKFKFGITFENAATTFFKEFSYKYPNDMSPTPPSIFKCTTIENLDLEEKKIDLLFENWPVALVGDGCSVNTKAGEILTTQIGLVSPTTRCSAHAASGSIRRLTTSKTMSVPEVVTFANGLKPILKHFKLSGKSSALLQESLDILEMKSFKLMMWCPTRMANLLECSSRTVKILFPLCDMLATTGIKVDQASYFLSPLCLSILHIMADLDEKFVARFLRKLDTNDATIFEVLRLSEAFTNSIQDLKTPLFDSFIAGLREDDNGNIIYEKDQDGSKHTITLNYQHRPSRNSNKLDEIRKESNSLKQSIISNLVENVEDQSQKQTIVEFASAFDLSRRCGKDTRINYVKQLHMIYGKDYTHSVVDKAAKGSLDGYTISIKYPAKLKSNETDLIAEFNSLWPVMSKNWLNFKFFVLKMVATYHAFVNNYNLQL